MFSLWLLHFLTLSTLWKEIGIVEKEGGFPLFDTDNFLKILSTAEIISQLTGKIGVNLPARERLTFTVTIFTIGQKLIKRYCNIGMIYRTGFKRKETRED